MAPVCRRRHLHRTRLQGALRKRRPRLSAQAPILAAVALLDASALCHSIQPMLAQQLGATYSAAAAGTAEAAADQLRSTSPHREGRASHADTRCLLAT